MSAVRYLWIRLQGTSHFIPGTVKNLEGNKKSEQHFRRISVEKCSFYVFPWSACHDSKAKLNDF